MIWLTLQQIEWREPMWAALGLAPLGFWLLARLRRPAWFAYADVALQPWATRDTTSGRAIGWRQVAEVCVWLLLAAALAGPRLPLEGNTGQRTARHDLDLVIAIDVSNSMNAADIAPTRRERAKLKVQDLLSRLHGERVALIAYAGEAGLVLPLTRDADAILQTLPLIDDTLFEEQGTHLAAAFDLALQSTSHTRSRALLLLTDADTSALSGAAGERATRGAKALAAAGMPLYVLALASDGGGDANTEPPDFAGYETLAHLGGGRLARVSDSNSDLAALYDSGVMGLPGARISTDATLRWRELYGWPLGLALGLLLLSNLRGPRHAALVLALATSTSAHADDGTWRDAHAAYLSQQYLVAQQAYAALDGYHARMGEGASAYRRKDYIYAAKQFTQAWLLARDTRQRADALFNLGNAYYFSGNRQAAHDAFYDVLRLRPNDSAARHNLARATVTLAAQNASAETAIPGRLSRGFSEGANNNEQVQELAPGKPNDQPLIGATTPDAERARALGDHANNSAGVVADPRAALKKVDLLRDAQREVIKQSIKQDAKRARPEGLSPW